MNPLAIVSAIGSRGDVNPMLAIGRELKRRGWNLLFLTSEPYLPLAQAEGFESLSLVSNERFAEFIRTPGLWSPLRGMRVVLADTARELIRPTFEILQERSQPGKTVLVAHPLDFASRIFRDRYPEIPLAGTILAPMAVRTHEEPAKLTGWSFEVRRPPWLVSAQYALADRVFVDRWIGRPINNFRRELGLPPVQQVLKDWYLSPDLVLGLFPDWFAPSQRLLPKQMRCVGFPLEDAGPHDQADSQLVSTILSRFDERPIVFAPGSANTQAAGFFRIAVDSCKSSGARALLLSEHANHIPKELPETIQHHRYAPFRSLLPHCRAIVHHGGIGTTSQALAAGIPQVVVAMAFDQFDNGERVERLGVGTMLPDRKLSTARLSQVLKHVLNNPEICGQAAEVARRFVGIVDPLCSAADEIECLLQNRSH